jgi:hypothetical protein
MVEVSVAQAVVMELFQMDLEEQRPEEWSVTAISGGSSVANLVGLYMRW